MKIFGNQKRVNDVAKIDTDIIGFHVTDEDIEYVAEYLTAAIVTRCLMEFGETPEILEGYTYEDVDV